MSARTKLIEELITVFWVSLYFLCCFGALMLLKLLLLNEYKIEPSEAPMLIIGTLVAAKVVVILDKVSLTKNKNQKVWVHILLRTLLYFTGVFILLSLEKSIEARHEYGGVINAFKSLLEGADGYHLWANSICVFGALLFFNLGAALKRHLGKGGFLKLLQSPISEINNESV